MVISGIWSSVYDVCHRVECAFIFSVRTECDVMYGSVICFVVRGCAVSRRYINVCNCDMFSVVNVYLGFLKFCVVCIDCRMYVCCSECNGVSIECNEPTYCLFQPIGTHGGEVMHFCFRGELAFLNSDYICMRVVHR